jgi:maleylacetoacetate isomerase
MITLYSFYRASAAYRARIALNLKGLPYDLKPVDLAHGGGADPAYRRLNPQGIVPTMLDGDVRLTQSLAIMEYLEERYPEPPLLPEDPEGRARVRALALAVACEMHPLNNVRVLNYLVRDLGLSEADKFKWYRHWIAQGLSALEVMVADKAGTYCHGDKPTMADVCLVPQMYNARRYECDIAPYPMLRRIDQACNALPAFRTAHPSRQVDADEETKRQAIG